MLTDTYGINDNNAAKELAELSSYRGQLYLLLKYMFQRNIDGEQAYRALNQFANSRGNNEASAELEIQAFNNTPAIGFANNSLRSRIVDRASSVFCNGRDIVSGYKRNTGDHVRLTNALSKTGKQYAVTALIASIIASGLAGPANALEIQRIDSHELDRIIPAEQTKTNVTNIYQGGGLPIQRIDKSTSEPYIVGRRHGGIPIQRTDKPNDEPYTIKRQQHGLPIQRTDKPNDYMQDNMLPIQRTDMPNVNIPQRFSVPMTESSKYNMIRQPQQRGVSLKLEENQRYTRQAEFNKVVTPIVEQLHKEYEALGLRPEKPVNYALGLDTNVLGIGAAACIGTPESKDYTIQIDSGLIFTDNPNRNKDLRTIIAHELIHTLKGPEIDDSDSELNKKNIARYELLGKGCWGHDKSFQKYAFKVDEAYDIGVSDIFLPNKEDTNKLSILHWHIDGAVHDRDTGELSQTGISPEVAGYYNNSGRPFSDMTNVFMWTGPDKDFTQDEIKSINETVKNRIDNLIASRNLDIDGQYNTAKEEYRDAAYRFEAKRLELLRESPDAIDITDPMLDELYYRMKSAKNNLIIAGNLTDQSDIYEQISAIKTETRNQALTDQQNIISYEDEALSEDDMWQEM